MSDAQRAHKRLSYVKDKGDATTANICHLPARPCETSGLHKSRGLLPRLAAWVLNMTLLVVAPADDCPRPLLLPKIQLLWRSTYPSQSVPVI